MYTADKHDRAKSDMLGEFNRAITNAADLRKAAETSADGPPIAPEPSTQPEESRMAIDVQQLAMQIYIQTVSPGIRDRMAQGTSLEKLFRGAAANSIAAAEEFARACEQTTVA